MLIDLNNFWVSQTLFKFDSVFFPLSVNITLIDYIPPSSLGNTQSKSEVRISLIMTEI